MLYIDAKVLICMIFANDMVLYLFFILVAAAYLFMRDEKIRNDFILNWMHSKESNRLTGPISKVKRLIRKWTELLCFGLIICALAHPLFGIKKEAVKRKGVDIVIAMDVSSSMLAEDYSPNRLQKAKQELRGLLSHIEGHRIGLLAFAGYAAVLCPITTDTATLQTYLDVLDTQLFESQGTALSDAIQKSVGMFDKRVPHGKAIVLITDGENHEDDPLKAAREAAQQGIHIYCIGIGSPTGEPIPLLNASGEKTGHKRDDTGEVILTKLDEAALNQIAGMTGGKYFRASLNEIEIKNIFEAISKLEKGEFSDQDLFRYDEIFQIPLFWALLALLWAEALGARAGLAKKLFSHGFRMKSPKTALLILSLFVQFGFTKARDIEEGNKLYSENKYDEAAQKYLSFLAAHPDSPETLFNLANTLYQKKDYTGAQKHYFKAKKTRKAFLIPQTEYGAGNVCFRKNQFEKALSHYKKTIELDPSDLDAKYNYEICLQKIKAEKEKKEKEEKEDQNKQKKQQDQGTDQQEKEQKQQQDEKNQEKEQQKQENKKQDKPEPQEQKKETSGQNTQQQKDKQGSKKQSQQKEQQPDQEKKEASQKTEEKSGASKKEETSISAQKPNADKKEGSQMTEKEALELLEVGHNDKKDLLYNLLRSQQQQNAPKKGKDW
jgi:Ca-activated chloride channel family protein